MFIILSAILFVHYVCHCDVFYMHETYIVLSGLHGERRNKCLTQRQCCNYKSSVSLMTLSGCFAAAHHNDMTILQA